MKKKVVAISILTAVAGAIIAWILSRPQYAVQKLIDAGFDEFDFDNYFEDE